MKNNTLSYRVDQLEKNYDRIADKLDKLLTNDMPHLHEEIISLETKINIMTAINIGGIIIGIIVSKLLR